VDRRPTFDFTPHLFSVFLFIYLVCSAFRIGLVPFLGSGSVILCFLSLSYQRMSMQLHCVTVVVQWKLGLSPFGPFWGNESAIRWLECGACPLIAMQVNLVTPQTLLIQAQAPKRGNSQNKADSWLMRKREVQSSAAQICSRMQWGVRKRRKWSWARM